MHKQAFDYEHTKGTYKPILLHINTIQPRHNRAYVLANNLTTLFKYDNLEGVNILYVEIKKNMSYI